LERPWHRKRTEIKDAILLIGTHSGPLNGERRRQGSASGATPHATFLSIDFVDIHRSSINFF
jgi:hypothetical protein